MEPLKQRVRVVFETLGRIGPISIFHNVGPKMLAATAHRVYGGAVIKGKFWQSQNFYATDLEIANFRMVLELEVHPETDKIALMWACTELQHLQLCDVRFTADESQEIVRLVQSGELAEFLK